MEYDSFCSFLLGKYKGSGYISSIRTSIENSKDMQTLEDELCSRGMFPGSFEALKQQQDDES
jgi:hypothetical protein